MDTKCFAYCCRKGMNFLCLFLQLQQWWISSNSHGKRDAFCNAEPQRLCKTGFKFWHAIGNEMLEQKMVIEYGDFHTS